MHDMILICLVVAYLRVDLIVGFTLVEVTDSSTSTTNSTVRLYCWVPVVRSYVCTAHVCYVRRVMRAVDAAAACHIADVTSSEALKACLSVCPINPNPNPRHQRPLIFEQDAPTIIIIL